MKRTAILTSAFLMQLCLGAIYSWSVFVSPLRAVTGLSQGLTQLPFTVFYFIFPAVTALTGTWLIPKLGPRKSAVLGGILYSAGWLLASLGKIDFTFTILGIGLLAGIGAGMAYIIPISVGMGWFPKKKGLVTGVAVAGFGGGAALISALGNGLIEKSDLAPFQAFAILGTAFLVLVPVAGSQLAYAPGASSAGPAKTGSQKILGNSRFQLLYLAMFAGLAAGFGFNANIRELYTGTAASAGVLAVSLFAVANGAGRIIWGWIADRWKSSSIPTNLAIQALVMVSVLFLNQSAVGFLLLSILAGFNYGGVLVLYAAAVEKEWGEEGVAGIYGLLFSANIPAAIAPVLAGISYDLSGNFNFPLIIFSVLSLAAAILIRSNR